MNQPMYIPRYLLRITNAVYECRGCGAKQTVPQGGEKLKAPRTCLKCDSREFTLLKEESDFEAVGVCGWRRVTVKGLAEELKKRKAKDVPR